MVDHCGRFGFTQIRRPDATPSEVNLNLTYSIDAGMHPVINADSLLPAPPEFRLRGFLF